MYNRTLLYIKVNQNFKQNKELDSHRRNHINHLHSKSRRAKSLEKFTVLFLPKAKKMDRIFARPNMNKMAEAQNYFIFITIFQSNLLPR